MLLSYAPRNALRSSSFVSAVRVPHRMLAISRPAQSEIPFDNIIDTADSPEANVSVGQLTRAGLELGSLTVVPGGLIFLGGKALLWDVHAPGPGEELSWKGWRKEAFEVFQVVAPRPEILLFGTGASTLPPPPFLRAYCQSLGIQLDVMKTRDAASTYNLLAEEGRLVSAAMLPVRPVDPRTATFLD